MTDLLLKYSPSKHHHQDIQLKKEFDTHPNANFVKEAIKKLSFFVAIGVLLSITLMFVMLTGQTVVDYDVDNFHDKTLSSVETDLLSLSHTSSSSNDNFYIKNTVYFTFVQLILSLLPFKYFFENSESKRKYLFNIMSVKRGNVLLHHFRIGL